MTLCASQTSLDAIGLQPVLAWNLAKRFLIRREKLLDGELPRKFLLDSPAAKLTHPHPLFRMIKQATLFFAAKSPTWSALSLYSDASWALNRPSVPSNCTIGLPRAMYSMILIMVDMLFIEHGLSGFTQTSAVERISSNSASGILPVKVTMSSSVLVRKSTDEALPNPDRLQHT